MQDKEKWIKECQADLGGGSIAELEANLLYKIYEDWRSSPTVEQATKIVEVAEQVSGQVVNRIINNILKRILQD